MKSRKVFNVSRKILSESQQQIVKKNIGDMRMHTGKMMECQMCLMMTVSRPMLCFKNFQSISNLFILFYIPGTVDNDPPVKTVETPASNNAGSTAEVTYDSSDGMLKPKAKEHTYYPPENSPPPPAAARHAGGSPPPRARDSSPPGTKPPSHWVPQYSDPDYSGVKPRDYLGIDRAASVSRAASTQPAPPREPDTRSLPPNPSLPPRSRRSRGGRGTRQGDDDGTVATRLSNRKRQPPSRFA